MLLLPVYPLLANAASLDELRREQEDAARKASELNKQANQKSSEVDSLTAMVNKLNADIAALQAKINLTQAQIQENEKAIADIEAQIQQKEAELKENQEKQAQALQTMYVMGRESTIEALISSNSLSEVVARDQYLSALEEKIEQTMREIKRLKTELETKRDELKKRRQELNDLKQQLNIQQAGLQEQRAVQQRLLANASAEMSRLKNEAAQQTRHEAQIEAQIQEEIARAMGGRVRGTGVRVSKGMIIGHEGSTGYSTGPHVHFEVNINSAHQNPRGYIPNPFRWPLDSFDVTQEFGWTDYAASGAYGGASHSGIDIAGPYGAAVHAAGDGEIILNQYYGGYGNAVVIDHGNGLWTLYGHMTGQ